MKKASELPPAVRNLRRIWDNKKEEMNFTQVQAAEKLGWSQGAISHYLNNLTELGPAATIKFANFLSVDPLEIDPNIKEFLPNTFTRIIKYDISNIKKPINKKVYERKAATSFWVSADAEDYDGVWARCLETQAYTLVCPIEDFPTANRFLVKLKGKNRAVFLMKDDLPDNKNIEIAYAVLHTTVSSAPA
jgi:transcriptional regulator with XRE-family HTH domain